MNTDLFLQTTGIGRDLGHHLDAQQSPAFLHAFDTSCTFNWSNPPSGPTPPLTEQEDHHPLSVLPDMGVFDPLPWHLVS
jgi:hypothetical protein